MSHSRHDYFVRRLKELGLYDKDSDYEGEIGRSIEELSLVFSKQGHSGMSAVVTMAVWNQLFDEWDKGKAHGKNNP